MSTPVDPILASLVTASVAPPPQQAQSAPTLSFSRLLESGLSGVQDKIAHADALAARFAVDDSIPVHQVTLALEEARLSVELMMQFRARLMESYQDVMRMQI
jgi:flagellar hook-basal body complex protein FliE